MKESKSILIQIKLIPNAFKDVILGWEEGRLRIRVQAVPEKGKANKHLLQYLADQLEIAPSRLTIVSGKTSRIKRIRIEGLSEDELHQKLG